MEGFQYKSNVLIQSLSYTARMEAVYFGGKAFDIFSVGDRLLLTEEEIFGMYLCGSPQSPQENIGMLPQITTVSSHTLCNYLIVILCNIVIPSRLSY
jgi:hypothetical protein